MDRGLVGTEGNEDNDGRGDYKTAGERTTGLLVSGPRGSHWSLAKEERDIG